MPPESRSPRRTAEQRTEVIIHRPVERVSQCADGPPPSASAHQVERGVSADRSEILVSDRVPPVDQLLQKLLASCMVRVACSTAGQNWIPRRLKSWPVLPWIRIALVRRSVPKELNAQEGPERSGPPSNNVIDAFGVKIATEPLKMRGEQSGIGVVDLPGRKTPARTGAADHACAFSISSSTSDVRPSTS